MCWNRIIEAEEPAENDQAAFVEKPEAIFEVQQPAAEPQPSQAS